jgi:hypothetical protein
VLQCGITPPSVNGRKCTNPTTQVEQRQPPRYAVTPSVTSQVANLANLGKDTIRVSNAEGCHLKCNPSKGGDSNAPLADLPKVWEGRPKIRHPPSKEGYANLQTPPNSAFLSN